MEMPNMVRPKDEVCFENKVHKKRRISLVHSLHKSDPLEAILHLTSSRKNYFTGNLIETTAHAPQRPVVTYTEMGTVDLLGCCDTDISKDYTYIHMT
ncbi:hypothetical protein TNCV_3086731 [Trichonephila clavipes]|nr:hypothetical protein TNCV_3086731 [Trichonephila clavipes]